jgi:hypothetical protein
MPLEEFREVLPPIEPGEGLGDALLPNGALLPPALNPALVSEPLPTGAEVAPEDVDAPPAAVPSVPAAGALTEPDALEPAPTLVPPVPPDCANAAGTKAASGNANDALSVNAISDFFILITCSSPLLWDLSDYGCGGWTRKVTDGPVVIRETLRLADANEESSSSYAMEIKRAIENRMAAKTKSAHVRAEIFPGLVQPFYGATYP